MRTADLLCARDAFRQVAGIGSIVSFQIDGSPMLGAFELDEAEHMRRDRQGVGAVTSCGLLHGLWMLPTGGPVTTTCLPDVKVRRLRAAPEMVEETAQGFVRTYSPPGVLRSVAFVGRSLQQRVWRAARFTPIVERYAIVDYRRRAIPLGIEYLAREWGVGIIKTKEVGASELSVPAATAERGVPGVYRWWAAEQAYQGLLYENAQLVS